MIIMMKEKCLACWMEHYGPVDLPACLPAGIPRTPDLRAHPSLLHKQGDAIRASPSPLHHPNKHSQPHHQHMTLITTAHHLTAWLVKTSWRLVNTGYGIMLLRTLWSKVCQSRPQVDHTLPGATPQQPLTAVSSATASPLTAPQQKSQHSHE